MTELPRIRWENATRWYEVYVSRDLLGHCFVWAAWGGKFTNKHGQKCHVVHDEDSAWRLIARIHGKRLTGATPYARTS